MSGNYRLKFTRTSRRQFDELDLAIRWQALKKLNNRLAAPRVPGNALGGSLAGHYRLKLRHAGIRVVYRVEDELLIVVVAGVGRRDGNHVYFLAAAAGDEDLIDPPLG